MYLEHDQFLTFVDKDNEKFFPWTKYVVSFILQYQLDIQQVSPVLTPTTQSPHRLHRLRAGPHKTAPISDASCNPQEWGHPYFWPTRCK